MKNTLLLLAICFTGLVSVGQDRSDGLVRLSNNRYKNVVVRVHHNGDVVRIVTADARRNSSHIILVDGRNWRSMSRYNLGIPGRASQRYYYDRSTRLAVRNEIKREIRQAHSAVRNAIRATLRASRISRSY